MVVVVVAAAAMVFAVLVVGVGGNELVSVRQWCEVPSGSRIRSRCWARFVQLSQERAAPKGPKRLVAWYLRPELLNCGAGES